MCIGGVSFPPKPQHGIGNCFGGPWNTPTVGYTSSVIHIF